MAQQNAGMTLYISGQERLKCPHCQALQPDEASAYVIQGTFVVKQDDCEACKKRFSVAELPTGQYRITPLKSPAKAPIIP